MRGDHPGCINDKGQIGLAMGPKRRRHANQDCVRLRELARFRGRRKPIIPARSGDLRLVDVPQRTSSAVEPIDSLLIDVETAYTKPRLADGEGKRQADISETDNADRGLMVSEPGDKIIDIKQRRRLMQAHYPHATPPQSASSVTKAYRRAGRKTCDRSFVFRLMEGKTENREMARRNLADNDGSPTQPTFERSRRREKRKGQ